MRKEVPSAIGAWRPAGVGMLLGTLIMLLQLALPAASLVRQRLVTLNWPVDRVVSWITDRYHAGNTDQLIPQAFVIWASYWLILGGVLGITTAAGWQYVIGTGLKDKPMSDATLKRVSLAGAIAFAGAPALAILGIFAEMRSELFWLSLWVLLLGGPAIVATTAIIRWRRRGRLKQC